MNKLLALLAVVSLLSDAPLAAQSPEAPAEINVLTYTNSTYHYHDGFQQWIYSPTESRTGGGFLRTHNLSHFHRYGGGYLSNLWANHSFATGVDPYEYYVESRDATAWLGALPANAAWASYSTNRWWWPGMTDFETSTYTDGGTHTNFYWWPPESRKAFYAEDVPNWTLIFHWGAPHQGYFEKWTNSTTVSTTLELFTGGVTNSTNDVTMQLNVWAYDNLRGRWLTWNEITVTVGGLLGAGNSFVPFGGGTALALTPDTSDNVYFLAQDNQRAQITFSFHPTNALPTNLPPGAVEDVSFYAWPARHALRIGVDRDGDGTIELAGINDSTSSTLPFLFWPNDDRDYFHHNQSLFTGDYYEYDDLEPTGSRDYYFNYIHNERDLEDFAPMILQVPTELVQANRYLRVTGGTVKLFAGGDGTRNYQTDAAIATGLTGTNGAVYLGDTGTGPVYISMLWFTNTGQFNLLFEAGATGASELIAELVEPDGRTIGRTRLWINIKPVGSFYDHWVVSDLETMWPSVDYSPPQTATQSGTVDSAVLAQLALTNHYVLFVHGWNMMAWEKEAFASTAFKRLWWQGYRGRFGVFRWPTYVLNASTWPSFFINYDCSEFNSWRSAPALEAVLRQLNAPNRCEGNVRVMAHSMGNVVTGEALRRLGTNCIPGTTLKFVRAYIAMQAAIPAHCYDRDAHFAPFPWIRDNETTDVYSYYWQYPATNYMADLSGAAAYLNYRNTLDFALDKWIFGQQLKPDVTLSYNWSTSRYPNSGYYRIQNSWVYDLNLPNDRHEVFSFGSEPRCFALGAAPNVAGFFSGKDRNLEATFGYAGSHDFHSKQFRSTIAIQWEFWKQTLTDFEFVFLQ